MTTSMSGPLRDLFHAWRGLRQQPGFLVAALLTLTIGIGANVTIFSLVNGLSLRPMPFGARTDRLVTIHPAGKFEFDEPGWGEAEISYKELLDFRAGTAASVEGIGAYFLRNKDNGVPFGKTFTEPGVNVNGGIEYFLNRHVTLKGEARYHRIDRPLGGPDPSGWAATLGIKRYF